MQALMQVIEVAQQQFAALLTRAMQGTALTVAQYQRYLSMQYHLTRGVQAYFLRAAAHRDLVRKKPLRKFLVDFANEEEQHYLVAANDLTRMGLPLLGEPFDVTLWHAYFRGIVDEHPFIRLGAACVLENISGGAARELTRRAMQAPFLKANNTKFLVLHQHEAIPHGDQIVAALEAAMPTQAQIADLVLGAKQGMVLYLRMAEWALFPSVWSAQLDDGGAPALNAHEKADIETVEIAELFAVARR
jgi:hypothetical protein